LGGEVEHNKNLCGLQVDVFVLQRTPDGACVRTAIECKSYERPLGINPVIEACKRLASLRESGAIEKGIIVARNGFTKDARLHCESNRIDCFTPQDLQHRVADFSTYLAELIQHYEEQEVAKKNLFIPLSAHTERGEEIPSVVDYIENWLEGPGQLLTLLGEYGSGKTTTALYLAHQLAHHHLESGGSGRIPIFIELRDFGPNFNLRGFLTDYLINQQDLHIRSYASFERLNREGRLVLVFDAFDEMAIRSDLGLTIRNFDDILSLVERKAKVIVTCRTSFFKDQADIDRLHTGTELYELLHRHKTYQVVFLQGFSGDQIEEYLSRYYREDWVELFSALSEHESLKSLTHRPILLNMIVHTILNPESLNNLSTARLYDKYIGIWAKRDDWRCELTPQQRMSISQALAFELLRQGRSCIHHKELLSTLPSYLGTGFNPDILEQYGYEVRTCTFLRNDLQGFYSFVHKSFAEFLAARYLLDELSRGNIYALAAPLPREAIDYFCQLVSDREEEYLPYIWDCLAGGDEKNGDVAYQRINAVAAYIAHKCGGELANLDLSFASFPDNTSLQSACLQGTSLRKAKGRALSFEGANLNGADLREVVFQGCVFRRANLREADFRGADLTECDFTGADATGADLRRACLKSVTITPDDFIRKREVQSQRVITKALEDLRSISNLFDFIQNILLKEVLEESESCRRALLTIRKWESGQSLNQLLAAASHCLEWMKKGAENMESRYRAQLNTIDAKISRLTDATKVSIASGGYSAGRTYTKGRNLKIQKRKLRKGKRAAALKTQLIEHRLSRLCQRMNEHLASFQDLSFNISEFTTVVSGAIFTDSKGLEDQQTEWLRQNGARIRLISTKADQGRLEV